MSTICIIRFWFFSVVYDLYFWDVDFIVSCLCLYLKDKKKETKKESDESSEESSSEESSSEDEKDKKKPAAAEKKVRLNWLNAQTYHLLSLNLKYILDVFTLIIPKSFWTNIHAQENCNWLVRKSVKLRE